MQTSSHFGVSSLVISAKKLAFVSAVELKLVKCLQYVNAQKKTQQLFKETI